MDAATSLETAFRDEWSTVLAVVARRLRDVEVAEEATAEAFAAASAAWARDGVPDRPGAWLMRAAWRRALDLRRRERVRGELVRLAGAEATREERVRPDDPPPELGPDADAFGDRLALVFACCHPALSLEAQVALTLRCVVGLPAEAIARRFLVPDRTMAQRLLRAKQKLRVTRIPVEVPPPAARAARMVAVRAVVYLVLTHGYDDPTTYLTDEAAWLAATLHRLVPEDAEVSALLALALLHQARTSSRWDADGRPVPLDEQDRSRWDRPVIRAAAALVEEALAGGRAGRYSIEAAIAAVHAQAPSTAETDWPQVAGLYRALAALEPSPVVELNRAVAVGMADGAPAGLAVLRPLLDDPALQAYPSLYAAYGHLLDLADDPDAARRAWGRAADLSADPRVAAAIRERHG